MLIIYYNLGKTILAGLEMKPPGASPSNSLLESVIQDLNPTEVRFSFSYLSRN